MCNDALFMKRNVCIQEKKSLKLYMQYATFNADQLFYLYTALYWFLIENINFGSVLGSNDFIEKQHFRFQLQRKTY